MTNASETIHPSASSQDALILRLLKNLDSLDPARIDELYRNPLAGDVTFEELVIRSGLADERQIAQAYSNHYLLPLFDPPADAPSPIDCSVARLLPFALCIDHLIAPLSDDGQTLEVAVVSPDSLSLAESIKRITGRQMRAMFAPRSVVKQLLADLYRGCYQKKVQKKTRQRITKEGQWRLPKTGKAPCPSEAKAADPRASRYIVSLLEQAFRTNASDIHLEPLAKSCRARLRVGGRLTEVDPPSMELLPAVLAEIKRLGKLEGGDDRLPQDGSIGVRKGKRLVDVRVSTCPTRFGEKVALRLLDNQPVPFELGALGLKPRQLAQLTSALEPAHGLVLVCGPAGSGKATTLYSCLNHLNADERNVCTIEDRIKREIDGICQLQTRPSDGLTQTAGLRAIMRQDPDVVMVSQMTDAETADLCVRGALFDHLFLSALATCDALGAIEQLRGLGVDSVLLSNTLSLVVSQRLLRRLCNACKVGERIDEVSARRLGVETRCDVFRPGGCVRCQQSGYDAKVAVFEVVPLDEMARELIRVGASASEIRTHLNSRGTGLLNEDIKEKVVAGQTSVEEALRVQLALGRSSTLLAQNRLAKPQPLVAPELSAIPVGQGSA